MLPRERNAYRPHSSGNTGLYRSAVPTRVTMVVTLGFSSVAGAPAASNLHK
jgi:hypothetical protein